MSAGEFDSQSLDLSAHGKTSGVGADLAGNQQDLLTGDASSLAPELMPTFRDPISGEIVSESGAASSEFPHPAGRYVQPVYGDEPITGIPFVDVAFDKVEQLSDKSAEIIEEVTPVIQEFGAQVQQTVKSASASWNDADNQWRAGLEQDLSTAKSLLGQVMNSDFVQNRVAGAGQLVKSFIENIQAAQYDLKNWQDQVAPTAQNWLDVASGTNEKAFGASSSLPKGAFSFNDKLFIWTRYVVRKDDTLSQISLDTTGDGSADGYNLIAQHNGIQNPDLIYPGQEIEIPLEIANSVPLTQVGNSQGQSSQEINGFVVKDEFLAALDTWNLGTPVSEVKTHQSGAQFQYFEKPGLGLLSVVSSEHGAFPVWGGVRDYYVNVTRGLNGPLGAPTSAEEGIGDRAVKQEFEHGYITWKAGVAQAFDSDGELLFQQPADIPSSPNSSSGGTASEALLDAVGADYFLSRPEYYTTGNIFAQSGYGSSLVNGTGSTEGNCTWYAHGRVLEMGGNAAALRSMRGNANEWHLQMSNGARLVETDELPQPGDIAQWTRDGMNHVAVVEDIYQKADGKYYVQVSESHYNTNFDGGANGTLHRVKEYSLRNPDRYIRVPGVEQQFKELPIEDSLEEISSYERNFDARIYEEGSDFQDLTSEQAGLNSSGGQDSEGDSKEQKISDSSYLQNSNDTLSRYLIPDSKLEGIGNIFNRLIGRDTGERDSILVTSNAIFLDKHQSSANENSLNVEIKAYNPHPIDALVEIYNQQGELVDIASTISANKFHESLVDGLLDAGSAYLDGALTKGFTDVRNFSKASAINVELEPGQSLEISVNSEAVQVYNALMLAIEAMKYAPELFSGASSKGEVPKIDIVKITSVLLAEEGLEIIRDGLLSSLQQSSDWKEFISSDGFKKLFSYLLFDVYVDLVVLEEGQFSGSSKQITEELVSAWLKKSNPILHGVQETLYFSTKGANIARRFAGMLKLVNSGIESARFEITE